MKIFFCNLKEKARRTKNEIAALFLACRRSDVPVYAKIIAIVVVGYALSPIDFIPDFIPVLGYLDDLILLPLGITLAIRLIPLEIMEECRIEAKDIFKNGKPRNYIAASMIVLFWVIIICVMISKFYFSR